jgi:hypothetical protein
MVINPENHREGLRNTGGKISKYIYTKITAALIIKKNSLLYFSVAG